MTVKPRDSQAKRAVLSRHDAQAPCRGRHRRFAPDDGLLPKAAPEIFTQVLDAAVPDVVQEGEIVRLKTHRVVLKVDEEQARASIESAFGQAGLSAPTVQEVLQSSGLEAARARSVLQILLKEGRLVRISEDLVLHAPKQ